MAKADSTNLDRVALLLSGLCLIHCLALPVALLLGPFLGTWLLDTETTVHWILLALALPVSAYALTRGFRRHGRVSVLWLGGAGLILMLVGASQILGEQSETLFTVIGVLLLLFAHIRNLTATHNLSHPHNDAQPDS